MLSVVVLAWDNLLFSQQFVESVRRNTDVPYELVVVDNGSAWEAANYARVAADRAVLQDATWYYWTWAASHAFLAIHLRRLPGSKGAVAWHEAFADALLARQRADGSWVNRFTDAKEDDPLIATPWAAAALAIGRAMAARPPGREGDRCPVGRVIHNAEISPTERALGITVATEASH